MQLNVKQVKKSFATERILDAIDLQCEAGSIAVLLGASGCGKTTLLRCIAGFEKIDSGAIEIDGVQVSGPDEHVAVHARKLGMMFQDVALFPHLTVAQNIAFGVQKMDRETQQQRVDEMLKLVGLERERERYPHEISGGQQQRVALARALAGKPGLLLMDEPFTNLDRDLRIRLAAEIATILRASGTTVLWVTHDQEEAMMVADAIGLLHNGKILQWGTPRQLYQQPKYRRVAGFIGEASFIKGTIIDAHQVETVIGRLNYRSDSALSPQDKVDVLVRPNAISVSHAGAEVQVINECFQGDQSLLDLELPGGDKVRMSQPVSTREITGKSLTIGWTVDSTIVFASNPG